MTEQDLIRLLATGYSQCKAVATGHAATISSLFIVGLAGSVAHCIGMCGPFVLSQVTSRLQSEPAATMTELHRLRGAALIPYHAGRMTTYAGLGGATAFLSGSIIALSGVRYIASALLVFAALFFLGYAARSLKIPVPTIKSNILGGPVRTISRLTRSLLERPAGWRGFALGLSLGFLPCGLLYGALAAAASTGDPLAGIFTMAAFALGTMPALLTVGLLGHVAAARWNNLVTRIAPVLLLVNGGFLLIMAWRTLQP